MAILTAFHSAANALAPCAADEASARRLCCDGMQRWAHTRCMLNPHSIGPISGCALYFIAELEPPKSQRVAAATGGLNICDMTLHRHSTNA